MCLCVCVSVSVCVCEFIKYTYMCVCVYIYTHTRILFVGWVMNGYGSKPLYPRDLKVADNTFWHIPIYVQEKWHPKQSVSNQSVSPGH